MKIVLDTNVLISAFVFKGFSAKVFDYCATAQTIILSPWILDELKEKLSQKFGINSSEVEKIHQLLLEVAEIIEPKNEAPTVCRDKDDNNILQIAEVCRSSLHHYR